MPVLKFRLSFSYPQIALLVIVSGIHLSAPGQIFSRIETSFNLTNLAADPFDYTLTDVRVQIGQPNATIVIVPAFYDGGTAWRARHSPMLPGTYQVLGVTLNGQTQMVANLQPSSWLVAGPSMGPGFVRIDPANTNRFITSDGRRYFPIGHNVAWDVNSTTNVVGLLAKLGAARENW